VQASSFAVRSALALSQMKLHRRGIESLYSFPFGELLLLDRSSSKLSRHLRGHRRRALFVLPKSADKALHPSVTAGQR
jgi:hypothetical protein